MKKEKHNYSKQGKLNRAAGKRFEAKIRDNLEKMGWTIDRWTNTIDYDRDGKVGKVVPAKRKYNPFMKVMIIGTGFPDFVCFKKVNENFDVIGIEVKVNGYLNQIERGMCIWLLENKIFSKILIAKKGEKKGTIEYINFQEKYGIK